MLNYGNVPPKFHTNTGTHTHTPITQCLFVLFKHNIVYFKLIKHFLVHIVCLCETTEHDLKWTKINWIDDIEWEYYSKKIEKEEWEEVEKEEEEKEAQAKLDVERVEISENTKKTLILL